MAGGPGWLAVLTACALLAVPTVHDPGTGLAVTAYVVALTTIAVSLLVGLRRLPASDRRSWRWIVAGTVCGVAGSTLWTLPLSLPTVHGFGVQDLCWLSVYPLTLRGVMQRISAGRTGEAARRAVLLDTLVVTSAAAMMAWNWLISPSLSHASSADAVATVVTVVYPLGDVVMFALAAALLISTARRGVPDVLLVTALALELPLDLANAVVLTAIPGAGEGWYRGGYLIVNAMIAAAVLYRRQETTAGPTATRTTLHGWRIVLLGGGLTGVALNGLFIPEEGLGRIPLAVAVVVALSSILVRVDRAVQALESAEQQLHHQVTHDHLTGAASRSLLFDELTSAVQKSVPVLFFVDLDGFKLVNDTLGHRAGDEILLAVVDRLTRVVRDGDLVARVGGDEFVIVCPGMSETDAEKLGRRIDEAVRAPLTLQGHPVRVGASIGILIPRNDTVDRAAASTEEAAATVATATEAFVAELLAAADAAMYEAKRSGSGIRITHLTGS